MSKPLYVHITYEWSSRYKDPPNGQPRVLAEVYLPYSEWPQPTPPEIEAVWKPGSGYSIYITFLSQPPKQMNKEALASVRLKRLRRRIEKKYPLLADHVIAEEIAKKPEYYQGITRADLQASRDDVIAFELDQLERARRYLESRGKNDHLG